jgi:nickel-dependent lactate racemase
MHKLQGTLQADSSNWGRLAGNVIRNDIDEAGEISRMDMKIDVLVNGVGDSIKVFAGKLKEEFMEACAHGRECYSTPKLPEVVDVIVANTYAKACQASLAVSNWKHSLKSNGIMVVIAQAPEGQGTHYLQGKFGKRQYAPGYEAEKVDFRKLIVFSEYKTPDPLLPIAETDVVWRSNWQDVVEDIRECFQDKPKVALLPNSDIQCDAKTLNVS